MRERITTCCEIAGLALICVGAFSVDEIIGMFVAGIVLLVVGVSGGRR